MKYDDDTRVMNNSEMVMEIIKRYGSVSRFLGTIGKVTHMEEKDGDLWLIKENGEAATLTQQAYVAETMAPTSLTVKMPEEEKMQENGLSIFTHSDFGEVRTIKQEGEPWFVAADVCRALEIGNPSQALTRLDDDERYTTLISNEGAASGMSSMAFVNEPGLYSLVLGSRKKEAKAFKRWITHVVIPAIRKTGSYSTQPTPHQLTDAAAMRAKAMLMNAQTRQIKLLKDTLPADQVGKLAMQVLELKTFEAVTGADVGSLLPEVETTYSATEAAQMLSKELGWSITHNRIGITANALGIKDDEHGIKVLDKSRYSSKEVPNFRYNEKGLDALRKALSPIISEVPKGARPQA